MSDICPTCGSDDPAVRKALDTHPCYSENCTDPFHDPAPVPSEVEAALDAARFYHAVCYDHPHPLKTGNLNHDLEVSRNAALNGLATLTAECERLRAAWAKALSCAGLCAGTFGFEYEQCDYDESDGCRECWHKALATFSPPEATPAGDIEANSHE